MALNLTIAPTTGSGNQTINVSGNENTGRSPRSKTITVQGNGLAAKTVIVNQLGKSEFVRFSSTTFTASSDATSITISGTSNATTLSLSISNPNVDWLIANGDMFAVSSVVYHSDDLITGDPGKDDAYTFTITLTFGANSTITDRSAVVTCTTPGSAQASCTVTQSAGEAYLTISVSTITMLADGTSVSFDISSNTSWTIS